MIGIFLLGHQENSDLAQILRLASPKALLCEGEFERITAPCGILLPGACFSCRRIGLCGRFWCIFDSQDSISARFAKEHGVKTLTCGFSPYDTVTLSSITPEQAVVTLQREIVTIRGTVAEPADHPVFLRKSYSAQSILRAAAALILMGYAQELDGFYF